MRRIELDGREYEITQADYAMIGVEPGPVQWEDEPVKQDYSAALWRWIVGVGVVLFWVWVVRVIV